MSLYTRDMSTHVHRREPHTAPSVRTHGAISRDTRRHLSRHTAPSLAIHGLISRDTRRHLLRYMAPFSVLSKYSHSDVVDVSRIGVLLPPVAAYDVTSSQLLLLKRKPDTFVSTEQSINIIVVSYVHISSHKVSGILVHV